MTNIHPTAIIYKGAKIGDGTEIGPYCVIGKDVEIGRNVKFHSHVCIDGHTYIGDGTQIFPFASIGYIPQDLKYNGEKSSVIIGRNNVIREYVTVHSGTSGGNMKTVIGDNCLLMVSSHVAHDCIIGNNVILANSAALGGHVVVGDFAILGGLAAVHQFVRIGSHAIIGGASAVVKDVIPYGSVSGDRARLRGINVTGMKRRNFSRSEINSVRGAFEMLFLRDDGSILEDRIFEVLSKYPDCESVIEIANFIKTPSARMICLTTQSKDIVNE